MNDHAKRIANKRKPLYSEFAWLIYLVASSACVWILYADQGSPYDTAQVESDSEFSSAVFRLNAEYLERNPKMAMVVK